MPSGPSGQVWCFNVLARNDKCNPAMLRCALRPRAELRACSIGSRSCREVCTWQEGFEPRPSRPPLRQGILDRQQASVVQVVYASDGEGCKRRRTSARQPSAEPALAAAQLRSPPPRQCCLWLRAARALEKRQRGQRMYVRRLSWCMRLRAALCFVHECRSVPRALLF